MYTYHWERIFSRCVHPICFLYFWWMWYGVMDKGYIPASRDITFFSIYVIRPKLFALLSYFLHQVNRHLTKMLKPWRSNEWNIRFFLRQMNFQFPSHFVPTFFHVRFYSHKSCWMKKLIIFIEMSHGKTIFMATFIGTHSQRHLPQFDQQ